MIDAHVHYTRPEWLAALWTQDLRRAAALWPRLQLRAGLMATPDALRASLAARGVEHAVIYPELSVAPGPQIPGGEMAALALTRQMNDATAALVAQDPSAFVGLAVINPFGGERDRAELQRAVLALGLRGVVVGASYRGQSIDSPAARPFLAHVAALEVPLIVHPTVDGSYAAMRDFGLDLLVGMPAGLVACALRLMASGILEDYPQLHVILTHLGGGLGALLPWIDAQVPEAPRSFALRARRFYVDTATASAGALHAALEAFGPDHLLIGSDWPLSSSARLDDVHTDHATLLSRLPLGPEGRAAALTHTARTLFGI